MLLQGHSKGNNPTGHSPGLCSLPSEGEKINIPKFSLGKGTVRVEKHFSPEVNVSQLRCVLFAKKINICHAHRYLCSCQGQFFSFSEKLCPGRTEFTDYPALERLLNVLGELLGAQRNPQPLSKVAKSLSNLFSLTAIDEE